MADVILISVRAAIVEMVRDGDRRPVCCPQVEWDIARALVKDELKNGRVLPARSANLSPDFK